MLSHFVEHNAKSSIRQLKGTLAARETRANHGNLGILGELRGSYDTPRTMDDADYKSKFKQGSEVLQALFEDGKSPLSGPFLRWKLWARWKEVVGETIAASTEPVSYHRGILWLWVRNSAWMQQMVFMREDIRNTINKKMGVNFVHTLRFTLDRRAVPSEAGEQQQIKHLLGKMAPESGDKS